MENYRTQSHHLHSYLSQLYPKRFLCISIFFRYLLKLPQSTPLRAQQVPRPPSTMTVLSFFSVNCATTPISPDSSAPTPPSPRETKIILPKKKPLKWSTGVAPGDYAGPPTTTKLRKYWGGEEDPLTSDDFIWNKDFMGRMKKLIQDPDSSSAQSPPAKVVYRLSPIILLFNDFNLIMKSR